MGAPGRTGPRGPVGVRRGLHENRPSLSFCYHHKAGGWLRPFRPRKTAKKGSKVAITRSKGCPKAAMLRIR